MFSSECECISVVFVKGKMSSMVFMRGKFELWPTRPLIPMLLCVLCVNECFSLSLCVCVCVCACVCVRVCARMCLCVSLITLPNTSQLTQHALQRLVLTMTVCQRTVCVWYTVATR